MRVLTEEQQKKRQHSMEWLIRTRWFVTGVLLFGTALNIPEVFQKRSQFPTLFTLPSILGFWGVHSVWVNILCSVIGPLVAVSLWFRVYNYQREQIAAEQEALRKASTQAQGVWPPPPQKF